MSGLNPTGLGNTENFSNAKSDSFSTDDALNMGPRGGVLKNAAWADDGNIYDSIANAVDAAKHLVILGEGQFDEPVELDKEHFELRGQGTATVINGGAAGPAVTLGVDGAENQFVDNFNIRVDPSSSVEAAAYISPDAASNAGNEYELRNIFVNETAELRGATTGFDVRNGKVKRLVNCTANHTSEAGFKTETAVAVGCMADVGLGGTGFDGRNRSRFIGCTVFSPSGNNAYSLGGASQAIGCNAYGGSGFGHFSISVRSAAIGCYSRNAPTDYAFDMPVEGGLAAFNTVDSPDCSTAYRMRGTDNRVWTGVFNNMGSTTRADASNGTRPRWNGVIGGGPIGGVDLSSVTGQYDGDRAMADGTSSAAAYAKAVWDAANTHWEHTDPTGTV